MPRRGSDNIMTLCGVRDGCWWRERGASPLSWRKKGREQFSAEKNLKNYGGNRNRNTKQWRERTFRSESENKSEKWAQKQVRNSGRIPLDFPTKAANTMPSKLSGFARKSLRRKSSRLHRDASSTGRHLYQDAFSGHFWIPHKINSSFWQIKLFLQYHLTD